MTPNRPAAFAIAIVSLGATASACLVPTASAAARPTLTRLADVNVNIGMSTQVSAPAKGATTYEWRVWDTRRKAWVRLVRGGSQYRTITIQGAPNRHMMRLSVVASNRAGSVTSTTAIVRVWGNSRNYPAKAGSTVRAGGWYVTMSPARQAGDPYGVWAGMQSRLVVKKQGHPSARPERAIEATFVDTRNLEHSVWTLSCDRTATDFSNITSLDAGQSGSGSVCIDGLTPAVAKGGQWRLDVSPTEFGDTTPVWFRSA